MQPYALSIISVTVLPLLAAFSNGPNDELTKSIYIDYNRPMNWTKRSKVSFRVFNASLVSLNRQTELKRLMGWAKSKGLAGPLHCYREMYNEDGFRLMLMRKRFPIEYRVAAVTHAISNVVSPTPRYLPRGSASGYRRYPANKRA